MIPYFLKEDSDEKKINKISFYITICLTFIFIFMCYYSPVYGADPKIVKKTY